MVPSFDQELMQLIAAGADDEQISRCLRLSAGQVRAWIEELLKRLGLTTRLELIFYACEASQSKDTKSHVA